MWEVETINPTKHVLRISKNSSSMNNWLLLITVLTSLLEAVLLPVLISLTWIAIYRIKREMNGSEFRLSMQVTHGSMLKLFEEWTSRRKRLSKIMFGFIMLLFIMNLLGKNIPNVMLSQVIALHNFTEISRSNMNLFKNDSNCMYTSCSSDLDEENFALVLNSTTLKDTLRTRNVKNTYWHNNTLYAVRFKINTTSCDFSLDDDVLSSSDLDNMAPGIAAYTGSYDGFTDSYRYVIMDVSRMQTLSIIGYQIDMSFSINMLDRCDIPFNMFYISPNFNPNVTKIGKLIKDQYDVNQPIGRTCEMKFECSTNVEWKKMQIVGTTPDNIELLETDFNNSIYNLDDLFITNVWDYNLEGKGFGESLMESAANRIQTELFKWRQIIKYKGGGYNYNFFDDFEHIMSQSLVSSVQSMTNDIDVDVIQTRKIEAPGIWIELTIISFIIFFVCIILTLTLTIKKTKNVEMLLSLSLLDFGIISNAIFKEDDSSTKTSWPFVLQDDFKHLITANEIS